MSRKDIIELGGVVARVLGYGTVEVECENNVVVSDLRDILEFVELLPKKKLKAHSKTRELISR